MNPRTAISAWQKIILVVLGLFLCFVLLEVGMRLGGFVLLSIQEYGNLQSIKQKGAYRILCIGESTTRGQYPHLLEQILNRRNIGVRFSVIDGGITGTNTSVILSRVESNLVKYHPDMVVAMMGINEGGRHMPVETLSPSERTPFIQTFRTYKLARLLWLHLLTKAKEMGFCKPAGDKPISMKAEAPPKVEIPLPETVLKETPAEPILAEDSFKKALQLDPKNDTAHVGLGALYRDQGKFSQAEDSFKKALEINPKNDHAYVGLGGLRMAQDNGPGAADIFRKACEINPKNDQACVQAGYFYRRKGQYSEAEAVLKKTIEINPRNTFAFFELGGLYREQGKLSQAEDVLKKALEIKTDRRSHERLLRAMASLHERLLRAMASLYEEMGKPELAQEYAEKANRLGLEDTAAVTVNNYRKLKGILDRKGIKLVCVQYPVRNVGPLKRIFENDKGVIFVDNEGLFKEAVKRSSYKEYFRDMFAGDFGHCTKKGNELLAQNIADVILREVFNKK